MTMCIKGHATGGGGSEPGGAKARDAFAMKRPLIAALALVAAVSAADNPIAPGDTAGLLRMLGGPPKTSVVEIPAGVYRFPPTAPGQPHVRIVGAGNLTITGDGATFVFAGRDQPGIELRDCQHVTLRGLRLERATPTCSQGVIERIEANGAYCVVRIDAGYPQDVEDVRYFSTCWFNVFSNDRSRWLAHYRGVMPPDVAHVAPDVIRVRMGSKPSSVPFPLMPGTPVAWRGREQEDLKVRSCVDCRLENITIAGGAGMCFHERGGGRNAYVGCRVQRAERPDGATVEPLLSSCADGFHSSGARGGPLLDHCSFAWTDDDAIAIHGSYAMVVGGQRDTVVLWRFASEENELFGQSGDSLRFYDHRGVFSSEAVVREVRRLESYRLDRSPDPAFTAFSDPAKGVFLEVACDRPVACAPGWLAANPACAGSGYIVRNCHITDGCARGILAKGSNGRIEGNTIERMARSAIEFNPEMTHWSEDDYAVGAVVRGNVIRDFSRNRQAGEFRHPGAITILGFRNGAYIPSPGGHRNVSICDNTISDVDGTNILITSSSGVLVSNNTFARPMGNLTTFGSDKGIDAGALVWCAQSTDVDFAGNRVIGAGPGMRELVAAGPGWILPGVPAAWFTRTP